MSHIIEGTASVTDLASLAKAAADCGGELVRGQTTFVWYQGTGTCDHAVKVPGASYEVGVVRQPDGSYKLMSDTFDRSLMAAVGKDAVKLSQHYNARAAEKALTKKGHKVKRTVEASGRIVLRVN